ncbi:MAG: acetyl-CoA acetyltransferase, partial [Salinirussus sp.]
LDEAGIESDDVGALFLGDVLGGAIENATHLASKVAGHLGLPPGKVQRYEDACATASLALERAVGRGRRARRRARRWRGAVYATGDRDRNLGTDACLREWGPRLFYRRGDTRPGRNRAVRGRGRRPGNRGRAHTTGRGGHSEPVGGLKSKGHPIGATGTAQIVELTEQLRGASGDRQVAGAERALAHSVGGMTATAVITTMEART